MCTVLNYCGNRHTQSQTYRRGNTTHCAKAPLAYCVSEFDSVMYKTKQVISETNLEEQTDEQLK